MLNLRKFCFQRAENLNKYLHKSHIYFAIKLNVQVVAQLTSNTLRVLGKQTDILRGSNKNMLQV